MKPWMATDRLDTVISIIPKNGHSSFKNATPERKFFTKVEAANCHIRVGVIRHPVARIQSMYKFLKNQHEGGATTLAEVPTSTYEAFIDYTFKNVNPHWTTQKRLLEDANGVYMPTVTHRFEDLDKFWPLYFDVACPHLNRSPSYELSDYREIDLLTRYHRDLTMWTISEMK